MPLIFVLVILAYLFYLVFIMISVFKSISKGERDSSSPFREGIMVFSEVLFTIIGPVIGFYRFDEFGPEIPFAKQYVFSVILLVISSSLFYWISRFSSNTPHPIVRIGVSAGLLQGIILCLVTSIHFIPFIPLGIIYPMLGFELLCPLVGLLLLTKQFYFYNRTEFNYPGQLPYREELGFTPIPVKIMEAPLFNRILIYGALVVPLVISQALFAYGCGQDIDALVKAFTHSRGFIFSM